MSEASIDQNAMQPRQDSKNNSQFFSTRWLQQVQMHSQVVSGKCRKVNKPVEENITSTSLLSSAQCKSHQD